MNCKMIGLLIAVTATASLAVTPDQDSEVLIIPPDGNLLRWFGHEGRTYFIQASDPLDPLQSWFWCHHIESGNDEFISHEIGSTDGSAFFRLHYTDDPIPPGTSLEAWDADGDGLSNQTEVEFATYKTNPLKADTSGDGISDGWATFYGLNPLLDNSAGLFQGGPETNLAAYNAGVQALPGATSSDHDGDGIPNGTDSQPTIQDEFKVVLDITATIVSSDQGGSTTSTTSSTDVYSINSTFLRDVNLGIISPIVSVNHSFGNGYLETADIHIEARSAETYDRKIQFVHVLDHDWWTILDETPNITIRPNMSFTIPATTTVSQTESIDPGITELTETTGNISKGAFLLPVDLDIVHPVTGELSDAKEDVDDGGYVSVQRLEDPADPTSDVTPKTKVKIHAVSGAQSTWKTRLKFNGADRYKIYRDEARTQEVVSEQTEFDATQDTTLFFHGLKKSVSRGGELVTMQININGTWIDGDSVKHTIVQSEFLIQVKAFIPYAWTEAEEITGPDAMFNPMEGRVAKGDLHPGYGDRPATPSFINKYSTDFSEGSTPSYKDFQNAPFRVCQTVIVTPYKELHATSDIHGERNLYTAPLSETFEKATSVNAAEMHLKMGFMGLSGAEIETGNPPELHENYDHENRTANRVAEVTIEGGGEDGAIPALGGVIPTAWAAADIHWRLYLKIWCDLDPLKPKVEFGGSHDSYPAYEIIVIKSDGNFKDIHRVSPAAGAMPGPNSLGDGNAINVGRTDTITE